MKTIVPESKTCGICQKLFYRKALAKRWDRRKYCSKNCTTAYMRQVRLVSLRDRFYRKVDVKGPNDCWMWTAARDVNDRGYFNFPYHTACAHRAAYFLEIGDIPKGMLLLHTCGVKLCVNPAHLTLCSRRDFYR